MMGSEESGIILNYKISEYTLVLLFNEKSFLFCLYISQIITIFVADFIGKSEVVLLIL